MTTLSKQAFKPICLATAVVYSCKMGSTTLNITTFSITLDKSYTQHKDTRCNAVTYLVSIVYAGCRYAECRYAECRYAECRYAECRYDECRYAECRSIVKCCSRPQHQ
jgi:hypothetical protein